MFSTVRSSSVVHGGNLHITWFFSAKLFARGIVFAMKECTFLFIIGFLQAMMFMKELQ